MTHRHENTATMRPGPHTSSVTHLRTAMLPLLLFMFIVAVYLHGRMGCADSRWSVPTAVSLIDQRNFDIDEYLPLLRSREFFFTERVGDHYYSIYPFGA